MQDMAIHTFSKLLSQLLKTRLKIADRGHDHMRAFQTWFANTLLSEKGDVDPSSVGSCFQRIRDIQQEGEPSPIGEPLLFIN